MPRKRESTRKCKAEGTDTPPTVAPNPSCCSNPRVLCAKCAGLAGSPPVRLKHVFDPFCECADCFSKRGKTFQYIHLVPNLPDGSIGIYTEGENPADAMQKHRHELSLIDLGVGKGRRELRQEADAIRQVPHSKLEGPTRPAHSADSETDTVKPDLMPEWNGELLELRYNGEVIKHYTRPAERQERLLASFQELGWPRRIDDPLDPGQLGNTVRHLNSTLGEHCPIWFRRDGRNEGVIWEVRASATDAP